MHSPPERLRRKTEPHTVGTRPIMSPTTTLVVDVAHDLATRLLGREAEWGGTTLGELLDEFGAS